VHCQLLVVADLSAPMEPVPLTFDGPAVYLGMVLWCTWRRLLAGLALGCPDAVVAPGRADPPAIVLPYSRVSAVYLGGMPRVRTRGGRTGAARRPAADSRWPQPGRLRLRCAATAPPQRPSAGNHGGRPRPKGSSAFAHGGSRAVPRAGPHTACPQSHRDPRLRGRGTRRRRGDPRAAARSTESPPEVHRRYMAGIWRMVNGAPSFASSRFLSLAGG
jgi:hypothetical protein